MAATELSQAMSGLQANLRNVMYHAAGEVLFAAAPECVGEFVTTANQHFRVEVRVAPVETIPLPQPEHVLTDCQRDIVRVLTGRDDYCTTSRVLKLLEDAGYLHGESTVRHALAQLVDLGILRNRRRSPRGYYLASRQEKHQVEAG